MGHQKKYAAMSCVALFSGLLVLVAFQARADIVGSAHDFSSEGWNETDGICIVCHTPHNADTTVAGGPLWNHELTTSSYSLYSSATLDAPIGQPNGNSKLCLSCHDGSVAIDNFGGTNSGTVFIDEEANVGLDLSDDHPVSLLWNHPLASHPTINFPNCTASCHDAFGGSVMWTGVLPFFGPTGSMTLECATCHDVHDEDGHDNLLRMDNTSSAMCLVCHQDK